MRFEIGCSLSLYLKMPQNICYIKLDNNACTVRSIVRWKTSTYFLESLLYAVQNEYVKKSLLTVLRENYCIPDDRNTYLIIRFRDPLMNAIDYKWNYRICAVCARCLELGKLSWILSTFGGALSAMGDYYKHFAEKAELVSYSQLQLASDIGDPVLVSRCKLFVAISLMQRNRYRAAAKIIRQEYNVARELRSRFLLCCCEGVWMKLRGMIENAKKISPNPEIRLNAKRSNSNESDLVHNSKLSCGQKCIPICPKCANDPTLTNF